VSRLLLPAEAIARIFGAANPLPNLAPSWNVAPTPPASRDRGPARLLRLFDDDIRAADMIEQDRRRVRAQLDKFVFTQSLIGGPQDGIVRLFLRAVVLLSFVVGPVLLLLGFQLRFLPYHSIEVTYVHRGVCCSVSSAKLTFGYLPN
jgi:hypothetical protein